MSATTSMNFLKLSNQLCGTTLHFLHQLVFRGGATARANISKLVSFTVCYRVLSTGQVSRWLLIATCVFHCFLAAKKQENGTDGSTQRPSFERKRQHLPKDLQES